MGFFDDLKFAQKYERIAPEYIEKYDEIEFCPDNKRFVDWDFRVKRGDSYESYEVKTDRWSWKTGNIFIEIGNDRMGYFTPSGINSTKSDTYIYIIIMPSGKIKEVLELPTTFIRKIIDKYPQKRTTDGSIGVVIPIDNLF